LLQKSGFLTTGPSAAFGTKTRQNFAQDDSSFYKKRSCWFIQLFWRPALREADPPLREG
jgi:hypothetical protein